MAIELYNTKPGHREYTKLSHKAHIAPINGICPICKLNIFGDKCTRTQMHKLFCVECGRESAWVAPDKKCHKCTKHIPKGTT